MLPGDLSMILPRSPSILFALRIFQALRTTEYRNTGVLVSITDGERNINRYVERFICRLNTAIFSIDSLPEVDRGIDRNRLRIIVAHFSQASQDLILRHDLSMIDYLVR